MRHEHLGICLADLMQVLQSIVYKGQFAHMWESCQCRHPSCHSVPWQLCHTHLLHMSAERLQSHFRVASESLKSHCIATAQAVRQVHKKTARASGKKGHDSNLVRMSAEEPPVVIIAGRVYINRSTMCRLSLLAPFRSQMWVRLLEYLLDKTKFTKGVRYLCIMRIVMLRINRKTPFVPSHEMCN